MDVNTHKRKPAKITQGMVLIEFLRHKDNWVFIVGSLIAIPYLLSAQDAWSVLLWFFIGWLAFLPQEYFTHVYVLHPPQPKSRWLYRQLYRLHYGHHDLPKRNDLMYMPLWLTVGMTAVNVAIIATVAPGMIELTAAVVGEFVGYLFLEWCHLICHSPYTPKTRLFKFMKKRHMLHHFHNEKHWYSISPPALIFDELLGTGGEQKDVPRLDTTHHLGLSADHPFVRDAREHFAPKSSGDVNQSKIWLLKLRTQGY